MDRKNGSDRYGGDNGSAAWGHLAAVRRLSCMPSEFCLAWRGQALPLRAYGKPLVSATSAGACDGDRRRGEQRHLVCNPVGPASCRAVRLAYCHGNCAYSFIDRLCSFVSMAKDSPAQPAPRRSKTISMCSGKRKHGFSACCTASHSEDLSGYQAFYLFSLSINTSSQKFTLVISLHYAWRWGAFSVLWGLDLGSCRRHESSFCIVCHRGPVYGRGQRPAVSFNGHRSLFVGMMGLGMGNGAVFQLVPRRFRKEIGMVTGIVGAAGGIGGFFCRTS